MWFFAFPGNVEVLLTANFPCVGGHFVTVVFGPGSRQRILAHGSVETEKSRGALFGCCSKERKEMQDLSIFRMLQMLDQKYDTHMLKTMVLVYAKPKMTG